MYVAGHLHRAAIGLVLGGLVLILASLLQRFKIYSITRASGLHTSPHTRKGTSVDGSELHVRQPGHIDGTSSRIWTLSVSRPNSSLIISSCGWIRLSF
jgi:hypothetical protein